MSTEYKKRALITGIGNLFLQFMDSEDEPSKAPEYAEKVFETPSLDSVSMEQEVAEKQVYLSNKLHDNIAAVQSINLSIDAAYFPENFAEEAQGMVKVGGGWSMPTNPVKKPFRVAFPITDINGDQLIINIPKATLSPVNRSGETQRDDINEQIQSFEILGTAMVYTGDLDQSFVYHQIDLAVPENKEKYNAKALLSQGWYDEATLSEAEGAGALEG